MRIFVVGANGRLGRLVVARALANGHEVTAFMRDGRVLPAHPALSIEFGHVADEPDRVRAAVAGHDAVLSGLGNPLWFKGGRGPAIVAAGVTNVVAAMRDAGVGRVVVPLAWGTGACNHDGLALDIAHSRFFYVVRPPSTTRCLMKAPSVTEAPRKPARSAREMARFVGARRSDETVHPDPAGASVRRPK